jgi:hypothetical protein
MKTRDSSVGIATGWTAGVRFPARQEIYLFSTESRPVLESTQPPVQWVPGAISSRVKRPGCEADHSPPSGAEVKNDETIPSLTHTSS